MVACRDNTLRKTALLSRVVVDLFVCVSILRHRLSGPVELKEISGSAEKVLLVFSAQT